MYKKKKYIEQVGGLAVGSLGTAVGAHALGSTGFTGAAGHIVRRGQAGLYGVSKFAPVAGTIIGVSLPIKVMQNAFPKKKIKRILQ